MRSYAHRQRGFSLTELMIALALGLMIVAGMTTLFVSNNNTQAEIERANRQVENGRYAMQLIATDLRNAGFYSELDPNSLPAPAALPDPCETADMAAFKGAVKLHVQGYDDAASGTLPCLADAVAGRDVLVVRHAEPCVIGEADCEPASEGGPFVQASLCNSVTELNSDNPDTFYSVGLSTGAMTLTQRDCSTSAEVRRLQTHIYFIAANNEAGDGVPTLKRAEVVSPSGVLEVRIVPLAEGIENLQVEYGIDANADGVVDAQTTDPAAWNGCAAAACAVANWNNVMSVRLHLLARNTSRSAGHVDKKSYVLGTRFDGVTPNTVAAANDAYKRHVFQSLVSLPNPTGRRL